MKIGRDQELKSGARSSWGGRAIMDNVRHAGGRGFRVLWILILLAAGCTPAPDDPTGAPDAFIRAELASAAQAEAAGGEVLRVGFVALDQVFNSELMAPYDVVHHTLFRDETRYMMPFIVSPDGRPVTTFEGITVQPHFSFETAPPIDILVIPSTGNSMEADLRNEAFMSWLREAVAKARFVITVCDGAFPLAATGALDGRVATTFPGDRDAFATRFPEIDVRYDVRLVADDKYITSVGGAMSYEPAFYLVERLYSAEHARLIAEGLVWDWDPARLPLVVTPSHDALFASSFPMAP
ncbi:MAG: DJ-1/PfpI family protein [Rhodothermales bacterium]